MKIEPKSILGRAYARRKAERARGLRAETDPALQAADELQRQADDREIDRQMASENQPPKMPAKLEELARWLGTSPGRLKSLIQSGQVTATMTGPNEYQIDDLELSVAAMNLGSREFAALGTARQRASATGAARAAAAKHRAIAQLASGR